jgi:hypothetical protein
MTALQVYLKNKTIELDEWMGQAGNERYNESAAR